MRILWNRGELYFKEGKHCHPSPRMEPGMPSEGLTSLDKGFSPVSAKKGWAGTLREGGGGTGWEAVQGRSCVNCSNPVRTEKGYLEHLFVLLICMEWAFLLTWVLPGLMGYDNTVPRVFKKTARAWTLSLPGWILLGNLSFPSLCFSTLSNLLHQTYVAYIIKIVLKAIKIVSNISSILIHILGIDKSPEICP